MSVKLRIESEANTKGIKKTKRELSGLEGHAARVGRRIAGFLVAAFALNKIRRFGASVLQAFGIQQKAVEKLRNVLANNGEAADALVTKYQRLASELQGISDHGDEAILSMMAMGRAMGLSGDNLENATRAAVGLSQAYGITLESAMRNIAKLQGNLAGELGKLIPEIKNAKTAQEKMNIVFAIGNQRLAESARLNGTYARNITQISNKWGDFKEKLGGALVSLIESTGILDRIIKLLDKMNAMDFSGFADSIRRNVLAPLWEANRFLGNLLARSTGKPGSAGVNPFLGPGKGSARQPDITIRKSWNDLMEIIWRYTGYPERTIDTPFGPAKIDASPATSSADKFVNELKAWRKQRGLERSFSEMVANRSFRRGNFVGRSGFFGGPTEGNSIEARRRQQLRSGAASIAFSSLSGADIFDALQGQGRTAQQLGERGNPMHVVMENPPGIGVD